jgi:hypothetical protein
MLVLIAAPLAAGVLTLLLRLACPMYVTGKRTGFCNYRHVDVLGGWSGEVLVAVLLDASFVTGLLLVSSWQARRLEDAA